eukprot:6025878-Alexandrium_andersonii.AAC.1
MGLPFDSAVASTFILTALSFPMCACLLVLRPALETLFGVVQGGGSPSGEGGGGNRLKRLNKTLKIA